jgi:hypothetical protein
MILSSFEEWATRETDYDLTREPGGFGYQSKDTQHAFHGWRSCATELMKSNPGLLSEIDYDV